MSEDGRKTLAPVEVQKPQALVPRSLGEVVRLAESLANTSFVPPPFRGRPEEVMAAILHGMEVGLPPMAALQNISVINGRPSVWGDAALAIVSGSGLLEWIHEEVGDTGATCTVKRRGWPEPVVRTFSMEDAKRAGLLGKQGPWQQYPRRMLQMRARSWALRDAFPDVLKGTWIREEVVDIEPAEPPTVEVKTERPKRGVAAVKAVVEPEQQPEPEPEPAPEPKPSRKKTLVVVGPDGEVVAETENATEWLTEYRRVMASDPERHAEVAAANIETLERLAKAAARKADAELRGQFEAELEAARALAGDGGQPDLLG